MFEVRATYEFDGDFDKDAAIIAAAGRGSDFSGAGACRDLCDGREHGWHVTDFQEAQDMKRRLEEIPDLIVLVRERTTYG